MNKSVVILCAGGPAPGINAVTSSVAKTFLARGWEVIGLHGGYGPLFKNSEQQNFQKIDLKMADRIHGTGGSALRMSRYKPKDDEFRTDFFVKHNVQLLVTVGGDDTASTAGRISKYLAANDLKVATIHVPKTIDNDLPLPEGTPTFGYLTAKEEGARITLTIGEDARTNGNWFVICAMGREAGHLAFGIGEACHAAMIITPEMFNKVECTFERIIQLMISSIVKRSILGLDYGIIMVSEGVFHFFSAEEIRNCGVEFTYDDHGHPELGTISKGEVFNTLLQRKIKELGLNVKTRPNDLGYELRCVRPIASDLTYCTQLGIGVFKLFEEGKSGCMVSVDRDGRIKPVYLKDVQDPATGKVRPRVLAIDSEEFELVVKNILHFIGPEDYTAAKRWLSDPEQYDFRKILGWTS